LALLLYTKPISAAGDVLLCFLFGFGNSAHMLAFSTAGDVVEPKYIGTSAAIVNGIMFIVGGIMISRPGVRIGLGIEEGVAPASLEMAQFAGRPLLIGVSLHARDLSTQARYVSIDGPRMLGRVSHGERHVRIRRVSLVLEARRS
jgi:hypothetical protein